MSSGEGLSSGGTGCGEGSRTDFFERSGFGMDSSSIASCASRELANEFFSNVGLLRSGRAGLRLLPIDRSDWKDGWEGPLTFDTRDSSGA